MSVITEYIKMHVACALLAVGVLVGLLMPSRACAAAPIGNPDTQYVVCLSSHSDGAACYLAATCHGTATQTCAGALTLALRNLYPSCTGLEFTSASATTIAAVGSYITFSTGGSCDGTRRMWTAAEIKGSDYDLSVEDAQLIILTALLLWGLAWGFRQFQRVGTQHHD